MSFLRDLFGKKQSTDTSSIDTIDVIARKKGGKTMSFWEMLLSVCCLAMAVLSVVGCSSSTPAPTVTPAHTPTPSPSPTPTVDPMAEFTMRTGDEGLLFAQWNRGAVRDMFWQSDTELLVTAVNGRFSYDVGSLTESALDDAPGLELAPEGDEIAVVDTSTRDNISFLQEPEAMLLYRYVISPDQKLIATYEGSSVYLWSATSGKRLREIDVTGDIQTIAFSPDSSRLLAAHGPIDSSSLSLWEPTSGEMVWSDDDLIDYIKTLAFSPDSSRLAVSGVAIPYMGTAFTGDPRLYVVNIDDGTSTEIESLDFDFNPLLAYPMLFLPDNASLLVAKEKNVFVFDIITDELARVYELSHSVNDMSVNSGATLLATSDDRTVRILDMEKDEELASFSGYADDVISLDFSLENTKAVSVIGGLLQILDIETSNVVFEQELEGSYYSLFGPTSDVLIRYGNDDVMLWDYANDDVRWTHPGRVEYHSPDRTKLLVIDDVESGDGKTSTAYLIDTMTGDVLSELDVTDACGTATPPDVNILAITQEDSEGKAWITLVDLTTGDSLAEFDSGGECSVEMDFSPSGSLLATIASGPDVTVWDVATHKKIVTFRHGHSTVSLFGLHTFQTGSPEFLTEDMLATKGGDWDSDEVYTWAMPSGENLGKFKTSGYTSHVFSDDGSMLFASKGHVIVVFNPITGEAKDFFLGHSAIVTDVVLSSDGTMMLSKSRDGTAIFRRLKEKD
jgi:WD40 repeat protein